MTPGFEMIHPGAEGIVVTPDFPDPELTTPAIVNERLHGYIGPGILVFLTILQHAGEHIVAVHEGIDFRHDGLPDGAFDRIAAAIDLGVDALDYDPFSAIERGREIALFRVG